MKIATENIWFTSDTHFAHRNICRGVTEWQHSDPQIIINATRDFVDLEKMNSAIVDNINRHVKQNDYLVHLGDWSFGGFESIRKFRDQIICQNIILILGNHDHHIRKNVNNIRDIFTHVADYEELEVKMGTDRVRFVLSHFPFLEWNDLNKGAFMLHGHCHSKGELRFGRGRQFDVGMDGHPEFRPYHIREVYDLLKCRVNHRHHPGQDFDNQK